MSWLGPTGQIPTGQGINVSPQTSSGQTYSLQINFDPILTLHTGIYTCISSVSVPPSTKNVTQLVKVQRKLVKQSFLPLTFECVCVPYHSTQFHNQV